MKEKEIKTNAIRILEAAGVPHEVALYPCGGEPVDAVTAAGMIGADPACVFKTLVAVGKSGEHYVFVIPGPETLDLRKAAAAAGEKSVAMIHVREINGLTGYVRGGCSPVGMKKKLPTFFDETAQCFDRIYVSAGRIGMQVLVAPEALRALTDGVYRDLTEVFHG